MSELVVDSSLVVEPPATPETPAAETPVVEAVTETPPVEAAAEEAVTEETTAVDAGQPAPKKQPTGMLAELISERQARKEAERRATAYEDALRDGKLTHAQPRPTVAPDEAEKQKLVKTAERLRLYSVNDKGEKVYDFEAARNVQAEIREAAAELVAPVQAMTMHDKAMVNVNKAVAHAAASGMSPEAQAIVKQTYMDAMSLPNGAATVAQPEVATQLWKLALGEAHMAGKITGAPVTPPKPKSPAAVITEPTGRRSPASAAITLPPRLASVYAEAGLDPNKGFGSKEHTVDARTGGITLE